MDRFSIMTPTFNLARNNKRDFDVRYMIKVQRMNDLVAKNDLDGARLVAEQPFAGARISTQFSPETINKEALKENLVDLKKEQLNESSRVKKYTRELEDELQTETSTETIPVLEEESKWKPSIPVTSFSPSASSGRFSTPSLLPLRHLPPPMPSGKWSSIAKREEKSLRPRTETVKPEKYGRGTSSRGLRPKGCGNSVKRGGNLRIASGHSKGYIPDDLLKTKIEVLKGELDGGNDGVRKPLKTLIGKAIKSGKMTKKQALRLMS